MSTPSELNPLQILSYRLALAIVAACAVVFSTATGAAAAAPESDRDRGVIDQFIQSNCLDCHSGQDAERGFRLDATASSFDTEHWEKVLLRVQSRQMPPPDSSIPEETDVTAAQQAMVRVLDRHAERHPYAGESAALRRMTRTEYKNAIRDLLAIEIDVDAILPPDSSSDGFDNITVAELSPLLMERYLTAATRISRAAIGSGVDQPGGTTIRLPADQSQEQHVQGLPLGTRGGTVIDHHFPRAGRYEIQVRLTRDRDERVEGITQPHELDILIDRKRMHRFQLNPVRGGDDYSRYDSDLNVTVTVEAGMHQVGATFVEKSTSLQEIKREPFDASYNRHRHPRRSPALHELSIVGPLETISGAESNASQSRLAVFPTRPVNESQVVEAAEQIFSQLMRHAYRRPIEAADLQMPMEFFHASFDGSAVDASQAGSSASEPRTATFDERFDAAIESGLTCILVNPNFLFRAITQPPQIESGVVYALQPIEVASRLSFFLWSSLPDEALLSAAEQGRLNATASIAEHTRRMLADPRSRSLVDSFADQWLYLRNLPTITPDLRLFPDFDNNLRESFAAETKHLFADVIDRDASVLELISSDHTFLNDRLAAHYGIPGVVGSHFRRVAVDPDWHRGGLLRHGSILTATSYATRTSPTIRGAWVLENILGTPPPPPPANVPAIKEKQSSEPLSFRDMLAKHREDATCASCHDLIDPVGFALDHYDAVGRWRGSIEGEVVDAAGRLPDGQKVDGVSELEHGILKRPELFVMALTEKLMTYGLGRPITADDGPVVRRIVRDAAANDYRFADLVVGITQSTPFLMRTSQ